MYEGASKYQSRTRRSFRDENSRNERARQMRYERENDDDGDYYYHYDDEDDDDKYDDDDDDGYYMDSRNRDDYDDYDDYDDEYDDDFDDGPLDNLMSEPRNRRSRSRSHSNDRRRRRQGRGIEIPLDGIRAEAAAKFDKMNDLFNRWEDEDRRSRTPSRRRRSNDSRSVDYNDDWISSEVSGWFTEDDRDDEDDDDEFVSSRNHQGRRRRKPKLFDTKGITNALNGMLNIDPDEQREKAREYEEQISRGNKSTREYRNRRGNPSRPGGTYRYANDDNDSDLVADYEIDEEEDDGFFTQVSTNSYMQKSRRRSWEQRAEATHRLPPDFVKAWGPNGEVPDTDALSFAAEQAIEEIEMMKEAIKVKVENAKVVEEEFRVAKADIAVKKKFLSSRREEIDHEQLRKETTKLVDAEEDIFFVLRKARAEVDVLNNRLEDLEDLHGMLLAKYENKLESKAKTENKLESKVETENKPETEEVHEVPQDDE